MKEIPVRNKTGLETFIPLEETQHASFLQALKQLPEYDSDLMHFKIQGNQFCLSQLSEDHQPKILDTRFMEVIFHQLSYLEIDIACFTFQSLEDEGPENSEFDMVFHYILNLNLVH